MDYLLLTLLLIGIIVPLVFAGAVALIYHGSVFTLITGGILLYFVFIVGSGFLIFIGMIIAPSNPRIGKYLSYSGLVGIMILLLLIETSIVGFSGYKIANNIKGGSYWAPCTSKPSNLITYITCFSTGHQPITTDTVGILGIFGFSIFGIIMPLFIFVALFSDFVETSGVVQNRTYQKIIGLGLGFMAYRGFIVSRLIYILDIGSVGVAVIALNFIWLGGILSYIRRSFRQWQLLEEQQELRRLIPRLIENLKEIAKTWTTQEDVARNFSDHKFMRGLELVVGPTEADSLKAESASNDLSRFKQKFIKTINDASK